MPDQRSLPLSAQLVPVGLIIVALVRGQRLGLFQIPLSQFWPHLSGCHAGSWW